MMFILLKSFFFFFLRPEIALERIIKMKFKNLKLYEDKVFQNSANKP